MGSRIAYRLLDHRYHLTVYDLDPTKAQELVAKSVLALAQSVDVILSCLTNDEAVQSVYTGPEGILAVKRPGIIVLEMSTISPESSRELQEAKR